MVVLVPYTCWCCVRIFHDSQVDVLQEAVHVKRGSQRRSSRLDGISGLLMGVNGCVLLGTARAWWKLLFSSRVGFPKTLILDNRSWECGRHEV